MTDQTSDPAETSAEENAHATHDGNAHADHVTTGDETRSALQKWGTNSPGGTTMNPTAESEPHGDDDKLPNQS